MTKEEVEVLGELRELSEEQRRAVEALMASFLAANRHSSQPSQSEEQSSDLDSESHTR